MGFSVSAPKKTPNIFLSSLIAVVQLIALATGTYTETAWQSSIQVYEYKSYGSVRMVEYKIPQHTYTSHWYFTGSYTPASKCDERTILIYLQHGSYPLITPLNETFPDDFYLPRTQLHLVRAYTNESAMLHILDNPLPGSWFAAILLGDYVDEKITVKDMGTECSYYLSQTTHIVGVLDSVDSILTETDIPMVAEQDQSHFYRFQTLEHTWQYTVSIYGCTVIPGTAWSANNSTGSEWQAAATGCQLRLATRAFALPDWNPEHSEIVNCSSQLTSDCTSVVTQPATNAWNYILLESLVPGVINFTLSVSTEECTRITSPRDSSEQYSAEAMPAVHLSNWTFNSTQAPYVISADSAGLQPTIVLDSGSDSYSGVHLMELASMNSTKISEGTFSGQPNTTHNMLESCSRLPELGRYERGTVAFQAKFFLRIMEIPLVNRLLISDTELVVLKFDLRQNKDIGGTLHFDIMLENYLLNSSQVVVVYTCIQKDSIPVSRDGVYCETENLLMVNSTVPSDMVSDTLYLPYPETGTWYIAIQAICYDLVTSEEEPCNGHDKIFVQFLADLMPCVDGGCGENGNCREYFSGVLHYSVCQCIGKWRGYGCTDDSVAMPDWEQKLAAILLTFSNLFFLPAILLSLHRRFWTEALVYFYTMFFSAFYHACDGDRKYTYCLMPYDVLAVCDFFGAILSFWVTIILMAKLLERMTTFLYMLGALALVMGVTWDRFSLYTFLVPIATALAIMGVAWTQRCYRRRHCYPSLKRWLFYLIPGVLIAGVGLVVYAFFETESNYHYTHSLWHACIALSIVFLLPPRRPKVQDLIPLLPLECCLRREEKTSVQNGLPVIFSSTPVEADITDMDDHDVDLIASKNICILPVTDTVHTTVNISDIENGNCLTDDESRGALACSKSAMAHTQNAASHVCETGVQNMAFENVDVSSSVPASMSSEGDMPVEIIEVHL